MKRLLFIMIAAATIIFVGCNKDDDESANTPPYAATTQTWTFGDQTWSDAIHCPECNNETFEESVTEPQCRSYTDAESGKTFYYYNWAYVDANKNKMCPSPWHVPTREDFETLISYANAASLADAWGYGGVALSWGMDVMSTEGDYWSNTKYAESDSHAHGLCFTPSGQEHVNKHPRSDGAQVRCVK
jgi:hypothetical protein